MFLSNFAGQVLLGLVIGVVLLLIVLRALGAHFKRRFVRQTLNSFPARVFLRRRESMKWKRPDLVQNYVEALQRLGFQDAGIFEIEPLPGAVIQTLVKPEEGVGAVITERPPFGTALDLTTQYQDGLRVAYTNNRKAIFLSQSPFVQMVIVNEPDPVALYRRFLAERPQRPFESTTPAEVPRRYEKLWAESRDYVNARGGFALELIRKTASGKGKKVATVFAIIAWELLKRKSIEGVDIALREQLAAIDRASFDRHGDRLVFINDLMTLADAADLFGLWCPEQVGAHRIRPGSARPRLAFAAWNAALSAGSRFSPVITLDQPIAADVYLAPGEPDG